MDKELERRLQEMLDKQDIHDLLMKYCRACDRGDEELLSTIYHEGGVDDHGDFVIDARDLPPMFVKMAARSPLGGMHFIGNQLIEVEGDTAFAESYFMAIKDMEKDGQRLIRIRSGRYIDRLERREGRWGIVERVLADEWNLMNPIAQTLGGPEKYTFGRRDKDDLVYAIKRGRVAREPTGDPNEIGSRKL